MSKLYSRHFFDYIERGAASSAGIVLPIVRDLAHPSSVLDVGCGRGVWLKTWLDLGTTDVVGIDGADEICLKPAVPSSALRVQNVTQPFDLQRRFLLVQCLEVAEHLPRFAAPVLIDNLVRHGDLVLFSAATPGQGGHGHINERPIDYWRNLFAERGFAAFDAVRPLIAGRHEVAPWYRFNTLLFAAGDAHSLLSLRHQPLNPEQPVPDRRTTLWRIRCGALRVLPEKLVTCLAKTKNRVSGAFGGYR